jgi:hypothetical protein
MKHENIKASENLTQFVASLTALSHRYGLALQDGAEIYVMDHETSQRQYPADEASKLSFV